jgi:hypothetical protein
MQISAVLIPGWNRSIAKIDSMILKCRYPLAKKAFILGNDETGEQIEVTVGNLRKTCNPGSVRYLR